MEKVSKKDLLRILGWDRCENEQGVLFITGDEGSLLVCNKEKMITFAYSPPKGGMGGFKKTFLADETGYFGQEETFEERVGIFKRCVEKVKGEKVYMAIPSDSARTAYVGVMGNRFY